MYVHQEKILALIVVERTKGVWSVPLEYSRTAIKLLYSDRHYTNSQIDAVIYIELLTSANQRRGEAKKTDHSKTCIQMCRTGRAIFPREPHATPHHTTSLPCIALEPIPRQHGGAKRPFTSREAHRETQRVGRLCAQPTCRSDQLRARPKKDAVTKRGLFIRTLPW